MTEEKNKPVSQVKKGAIQVSKWKNKDKEGNDFFSYTLQRSYKVGEEWKTQTINLNEKDLLPTATLLQSMYLEGA